MQAVCMLGSKRETPEVGKEVAFAGITILLCLLRPALVYGSYPSVNINSALFHSQKFPSLDDKLYGHPSYFDSQGKLSPDFEWRQEVWTKKKHKWQE